MSELFTDGGESQFDIDAADPESRTHRPVWLLVAAGLLLISVIGVITTALALNFFSKLSGGANHSAAECQLGEIGHTTQADETAAEFLDRNGYPPTMLASAHEFRDVSGQPLCPQGSDLDTCKPGAGYLICLPPPLTATSIPASTEPPTSDAQSKSATKTPVPTPTATPTPYIPPEVCGNQICNPDSENSDLCPQDCPCKDNGVCEAGEGANCLDCGANAGSCQAPCTESSQCANGLACASGICWDACTCGGQCGAGSGSSSGGGPVGCDPKVTDWTAAITLCKAQGGTWNPANCTCQ